MVWRFVMFTATLGNAVFVGLHLWEHDIKLAIISLFAFAFCFIGLIGTLRTENY